MSWAKSSNGHIAKKARIEIDPPQLNERLPSLQDVETTTKKPDEAPLPVDFLLLTVKDCEFLACYKQLVNPFRCWYDNIGFVYFENAVASNKVKVALIRSNEGSSGPGGALITVKNAVPVLRPKAVISVGTCSSLNPEKAKLGDVVVSAKLKELSTGMRSYVSRRFFYVIKHSADGFKAPLKIPQGHEPNVHCDGEFLSGPELVSAELRRKELAESHPQAIAIEREGEGVFTAAFDDQIEWLIVKGIADYADGTKSTTESWSPFASVMAASVVAHILSDSCVFRTWPHYGDASYPSYIIKSIRQLNKTCEERLLPVPWCEDFSFHLNDIFTRLKIVGREQTQGTLTDEITNMTAIFKAHKDCQTPRTVLIEGDPGMGKTTYCQKLAYDWATKQDEWDESFPETDVLLLLRCRDIKSSSIKEAIDDQILPDDVNKEDKEAFFQFISENQLNVLLVLDGVDEVDASKLEMIKNLLQSKEFANCRIVLTSRHEAGKKVRRYCDTLWEILGFTKRDAQSFIAKYFKNIGKEHLADQLLAHLWPSEFRYASDWKSRDLSQLTKNPLNTALLCILFENLNGMLPENRTKLYIEFVLFVLRRYERKNGFSSNSEDLISVYKKELIYLGRMAFQALRKGELDFEENESGDAIFSLLIKFGFLKIQAGGSKRKPCLRCGFFHKSFQEFFSGFYLAFEISDEDINYLVTDKRYLRVLKEVFLFMTGITASQCEQTAVCLVSRVASLVNLFCHESESKVDSYLQFALYYITQCANHQENLKSRLVDTLGRNLNIKHFQKQYNIQHTELLFEVVGANSSLTHLGLSENRSGKTGAESLSRALIVNSSLTDLDLSENSIGDTGAESLSWALTVNSSLTNLNLRKNSIGDTGPESLSWALTVNSSLTNLNLSENWIGYSGAESLSRALSVNSSLANLDLSENCIGYSAAESLSRALTVNSSLTNFNLSENSIGDTGAEFLSRALTVNSSLTNLDLSDSGIGDTGAASLSQALTVNSSLTNLNLSENSIGDTGAEFLSHALTVNSSLTNLNLSGNSIGYSGAESLSQALTVNFSLTNLDLSGNSIGDTGAEFLSQALKVNSSLTNLNLRINSIGYTGAEFLSLSLTVNSSLTNLDLSWNSIGDTGAASLSQALTVNSSLTNLALRRNIIGHTGAASLSQALTVNSSLTNLDLCGNSIGYSGAESLFHALTVNSSLFSLDLSCNSIGDTGFKSLSHALTVNSSLTNLDLSNNGIGDTGVEFLSQALKVNSSLTNLDLSNNGIGDTGVEFLSKALTVNSSLTDLHLSWNSIGDTGAESLSQALTVNSSLTNLVMFWNSIGGTGADYLSNANKVNKTLEILI